jgi:hypothetical protein
MRLNPFTWGKRPAPAATPAPAAEAGASSFEVDDVIATVRRGIYEANLSRAHDDLAVVALDLELSVARDDKLGADASFKVPVIGLDVGLSASTSWSQTSSIKVTLVPPQVAGKAQALDLEAVQSELVGAIAVVRAAVRAGAEGDEFKLKEASVELVFGVATDGSIKLLGQGERGRSTTHTITLTLGPGPTGRGGRPPKGEVASPPEGVPVAAEQRP